MGDFIAGSSLIAGYASLFTSITKQLLQFSVTWGMLARPFTIVKPNSFNGVSIPGSEKKLEDKRDVYREIS